MESNSAAIGSSADSEQRSDAAAHIGDIGKIQSEAIDRLRLLLYLVRMPAKTNTRQSAVPRGTNPIEFLMQSGLTVVDLAHAWGLKTTDAVYKLRRYEHAPKVKTAERMAQSFGWTPGEVVNHWLENLSDEEMPRVNAAKVLRKATR